jgi:hypothetical protein
MRAFYYGYSIGYASSPENTGVTHETHLCSNRANIESNALRDAMHGVFLRSFAVPRESLDQRGLENPRADVQIGGGVLVRDAFQATVES